MTTMIKALSDFEHTGHMVYLKKIFPEAFFKIKSLTVHFKEKENLIPVGGDDGEVRAEITLCPSIKCQFYIYANKDVFDNKGNALVPYMIDLDVDENNDVEDLLDKLKQMLQDEFKEKIE